MTTVGNAASYTQAAIASNAPELAMQALPRSTRFPSSALLRFQSSFLRGWLVTWTGGHAVAAALAPRLKGLNITTDLMQVGKVVTGQQL